MRKLIVLFALVGVQHLYAQSLREIILPFNDDQCQFFELDVQRVIDSVYLNMREGEKVKLCLYTRSERRSRTQSQLQVLATKRAELVNAYLAAKKSVPSSQINQVIPFDYTLPENKQTLTDKLSPELEKPIPGIPAIILTKTEPYQKYYSHLNDSLTRRTQQEFVLNSNYESRIYTRGGLELFFQPNSFVLENGTKHGCETIQIKLEEYNTIADMLGADLTTHSNGKMLESGGMIYIEAWCGNQKLKLAPNQYFEVLFPNSNPQKGMKTFNGRKSPSMSDWILQKGGEVKIVPDDIVAKTNSSRNENSEISYDDEGGEYFLDAVSEDIYNMTDGYLLKSRNLGWINCDLFYNVEKKSELLVSSDSKENICYRLVFRDIKSIMPAYDCGNNGQFKFEGVPYGEKVVLVAYFISRDKKTALFAAREIILGESKVEVLQLQPMDPLSLNAQFNDLFPN